MKIRGAVRYGCGGMIVTFDFQDTYLQMQEQPLRRHFIG
jgi:hypothetical protein